MSRDTKELVVLCAINGIAGAVADGFAYLLVLAWSFVSGILLAEYQFRRELAALRLPNHD